MSASNATPIRVLPDPHSRLAAWPLHDVESSRAIEAHHQDKLPPHTLMQRAGLAVARLGLAIAPHASRIWIAAGPGNNGGDGLEAAIHLRAAGKDVLVTLLGDSNRLPADARASLARAQAAGVPIAASLPTTNIGGGLVIDALLGLGSSRAPQGPIAEAIREMNRLEAPTLSIDLPTGLDAGTGRLLDPSGAACVRAQHTLALLTLKPGLFTAHGRDHAGVVWFDGLGAEPTLAASATLPCHAGISALAPSRRHAHHKGSFGDVLVLGGAPGMAGAAFLCARAASAAGAGRVYLGPLDSNAPSLDPGLPELMLRDTMARDAMDWRSMTLACGCGGGDAVREVLPRALSNAPRLVLDADGLNAVASDLALQSQLKARAQRGLGTILTPHPLEAARLLGCDAATVQADRLAAATSLAGRHGCVVILKGSGSIVASPGAAPSINPTGNAALSTAGTGDVLAGWLAGLWTQGLEARAAALAATYLHGRAADRWIDDGHTGALTASRLIGLMQSGP